MSQRWKRILIGAAVVALVVFGVLRYIRVETKSHSPEETVTFYLDDAGTQVEVFYCRPYKKGRVVFGGLVPYGKVWRTGANEATTISLSKDMRFGDAPVKAGKYTLWSMPGADEWTIYLNSKMYNWGIDMDGNAMRDPAFDIAAVHVPVVHDSTIVEQFSINLTDPGKELVLAWDDVRIKVPITL